MVGTSGHTEGFIVVGIGAYLGPFSGTALPGKSITSCLVSKTLESFRKPGTNQSRVLITGRVLRDSYTGAKRQ
jgi:hypothetical protein